MSDRYLSIEGWEELAKTLGIFKSALNDGTAVPSVTLEMDSKGVVKPTIKIYHENPYEAMEIAADIFEKLRERFT